MKKIVIFVISFFIVTFVSLGIIYTRDYMESNNYKLKKLGYNEKEIEKITTTYENSINVFMEKYYEIDLFINNDNFDIQKLDEYEKYINKFNSNYEEAIKMVNADLSDYKYNEILLSFKEAEYFIKENINRYLEYYNINKKDIRAIISEVNCNLDSAYYTNTKETNLNDNLSVIVNKYYYLPSDYIPNDLVTISSNYGNGTLKKEAYKSFKKLSDDAKKEELSIYISSGYRSYDLQNGLYNMYLKNDLQSVVDTYSARPGFSEHQTGLAIDVNTISDSFAYTNEYTWLKENAYKYGFILRYPKECTNLTGYKFEPWHYRYVGVDIASYIQKHGITYDEYYEYFLKES